MTTDSNVVETIFKTQEGYNECSDCQSVLSPAAYFVKLVEIVNEYIKQDNPEYQLKTRRPDLMEMKLDCDSTNKIELYLEIVNKIIEKKLKKDFGPDVLKELATAKYPFNLPVNIYLTSIRAYLEKYNISLADIYKELIADSNNTGAESLNLCPEEYELVTVPQSGESELKELFGIPSDKSLLDELKSVDKFNSYTGICRNRLQLILDNYEEEVTVSSSDMKVLLDAIGSDRLELLLNIYSDTGEDLNRLKVLLDDIDQSKLRLFLKDYSKESGTDFDELELLLNSYVKETGINSDILEKLIESYNQNKENNDEETISLEYLLNSYEKFKDWVLKSLLDSRKNERYELELLVKTYRRATTTVQSKLHKLLNNYSGGNGVTHDRLKLLVCDIDNKKLELAFDFYKSCGELQGDDEKPDLKLTWDKFKEFTLKSLLDASNKVMGLADEGKLGISEKDIINLSNISLSFLRRFITLADKLSWSYDDLAKTLVILSKKDIDKDVIKQIAQIKNLEERFRDTKQLLSAILGLYSTDMPSDAHDIIVGLDNSNQSSVIEIKQFKNLLGLVLEIYPNKQKIYDLLDDLDTSEDEAIDDILSSEDKEIVTSPSVAEANLQESYKIDSWEQIKEVNKFAESSGVEVSRLNLLADIYNKINDLERINSLNRNIKRTEMATAVVNDKAIFFGGLEDNKSSGKVDIYNTATLEWEEGANSNQADICTGKWEKYLHEKRQNATVAVINDKAIFFGGKKDKSTTSNKIDIYDSKSGNWEKDTRNASEARENAAVAVIGKKAVFFSGRRSNNTYSSKIDIYNSETGDWEISDTSNARENVAVAEIGNKVIFFGGRSGVSTSSRKIDIYDSEALKWEENVPDASEARENAAVAVIGDRAIFFFGSRAGVCSSAIDIYNVKTGEWIQSTYDISEPRENIAVAVIGSKVIFFGGRTSTGNYSANIDIYDADTEVWEKAVYSASEAREGAEVVVVGKKAIFFGGKKISNQYSSKVDTYDYETDKWESFDVKIPLKDIIVSNKEGMITFIGRDMSSNVQKYVLNDKGTYSEGELNFSYRFIYLSKKLDWSFSELGDTLIAIGEKEFDKDAIEEIIRIKNLQKRFEQPLSTILGFYFKSNDLLNITESLPGVLYSEIEELSKDNCSKLKSIINQDVKTYFKLDQDDDTICRLFDSFRNGKTEGFEENEKPFILFLQKTILLSKLTGRSIENLVQLMLTLKVQEINIVEIAPGDEIQELSKNNCSKLKNVINEDVKAHFKLTQDDCTICTTFVNFTEGRVDNLEEETLVLLLHRIILLSNLTGISIENLVQLMLKLKVQEIDINALELIANINDWFNEQGFSIESFEKVLNLIEYKTVLLSRLERASIKEFVQLMLSLNIEEVNVEKIVDTLKLRDWLDEYNFSIETFDEANRYLSKASEKVSQIKELVEKDEVVNREDFYKAIKEHELANVDNKMLDATYDFTEEYIDRKKSLEPLGKSINRRGVKRVEIDSKLIFFGGIESDGQYSAKIDIYDVKKERWEKEDFEASEARIVPVVAKVDNKVLFFCGKKGETEYSKQVDIYDSITGEWTKHTVSEGRTGVALAVVGKEVIFFCGYNGNHYSSRIDIYDSVSGEWRENRACEVRENAKVAVIENKKAVFFSGYNLTDYRIKKGKTHAHHKFSGKIDIYDAADGKRWSDCTAEEFNKTLEKNSRGTNLNIESAVIKNQVIFFGSYKKDKDKYVSIRVVYDSESKKVYDESQEASIAYGNVSVAITCKHRTDKICQIRKKHTNLSF